MTTIEEKRKELEDNIKKIDKHFEKEGQNVSYYTILKIQKDAFKNELKGFNLGVELAQKEFLEKIDKILEEEDDTFTFTGKCKVLLRFLYDEREELKKAVGK